MPYGSCRVNHSLLFVTFLPLCEMVSYSLLGEFDISAFVGLCNIPRNLGKVSGPHQWAMSFKSYTLSSEVSFWFSLGICAPSALQTGNPGLVRPGVPVSVPGALPL